MPIGVNHVNQRIEPDEPSKSRPTSSPNDVGQDPAASSISRAASHVAQNERSPLRIVVAENEPEGARTEGSGGGEMKYRRATIVAHDWHGEFGSYDDWATLGPQPPYRTATFFDAHGRRCITQHDFARARDDRAFPLRYRWERTEPRKRQGRRTL